MSKKWTEVDPRADTIVDYKEFNSGYNAYKSSFNGNLDRTTLPDDFLDETSLVAGAFHKVQITNSNDMSVKVDTSTGSDKEWRGMSYATYSGGWIQIDSVSVTDFKDGMCHWEYKFLYHNYLKYSWSNSLVKEDQKGIQVRLRWDGVIVFESYKMPQPIGNIRLIADFPTTGGDHTATVEIRQVQQGTNDPPNVSVPTPVNVVNVCSPSHLFIGRWR